ncbi:MAG: phosphocarrier protein HPr [Ignavibacteria bacterium GWF2_33_9]|nr:MAG: phosphocarrier protein HPr [Ignavibacteria bacterium GWF2_33_9]
MTTKEVEIVNRAGIHTRPASLIVKTAARFKSEIYIGKDGYEVNAKSIIGVMTLAASKGTVLLIKAYGDDESDCVDALIELISSGFGEP